MPKFNIAASRHIRFSKRSGHRGRFGRGASLYSHRSQLSGRLWVRLLLPTGQFSKISFSACNVRSCWFIGIEWGLESVDLGSIFARAAGFNGVMTVSKLCTYTCALAIQAIHPFGVGKLVPAIYLGNSTLLSVRGGEVDG